MDYAIVALERVLRVLWPEGGRLGVLRDSTLDLAGALISPLLGVLLSVFLAMWSAGIQRGGRISASAWWAVALLAALSPPLVHATVFGRPDHQSLLLLLLAVALGAEQRMQSAPSLRWAWGGGLAWGGALWVSLYEPLVLLGAVFLMGLWPWRPSWTLRERAHWAAALALPLASGWFVDGIRIVRPDSVWTEALKRWASTIGELQKVASPETISQWTGLLVWVAPMGLLWLARREGRVVLGWLAMLVLTAGLTLWQVRWSPYFVLVFLVCLPFLLSIAATPLRAGVVFTLSLWPVVTEWEHRIFPDAQTFERRYMERSERLNARLAAERMRSPERMPFIAVWWQSPALAYWSGQPAVAGSGHEGISGIVDSARFFLCTEPLEAREILERRGVRLVVASDSARAVENSVAILGHLPKEKPLAERLWQSILPGVWGLQGESNVTTFRVLRVE
ncbi:MAG: hypothetical protein DVB28_000175 [Verrucomicrobia bacterium]|nr:MAG: hypothetical protein DVB28_000175 [Verrucomicrobiota bacterium]